MILPFSTAHRRLCVTAASIFLLSFPVHAKIDVFFTPGAAHTGGASSSIKTSLITFLQSATKSIDIAVFSFSDREIIEALNAIPATVTIRVVVDDNNGPVQTSDGSVVLSGAIPTKFDNDAALHMHHKFVIVDRGESGAAVWTGSANFNRPNLTTMNNNAVIIYSAEVAATYGAEFDLMYTSNKFHTQKATASTTTSFTVEGIPIEVRFAPRDLPMDKLVDSVNSLSQSLYFAIFAAGSTSLKNAMIAKKATVGSSNFGWFDKDFTENSAPAGVIFSDLGAAGLTVAKDDNADVMHHKFAVLDGATVFMGSMNFTVQGGTENDENSVIIRDAAVAKAYLAELARISNRTIGTVTAADWKESITVGTASTTTTTTSSSTSQPAKNSVVAISYPNPFVASSGSTIMISSLPVATITKVRVYTTSGKLVTTIVGTQSTTVNWNGRNIRGDLMGSGIYVLELETEASGTARGMLTLVR